MIIIKAGGKPVYRNSQFFKNLIPIGKRNGRSTYKNINEDYYYQWDSLHGEWQVYNKKGRHIGVLNEIGNKKIKNAKKSRKINI